MDMDMLLVYYNYFLFFSTTFTLWWLLFVYQTAFYLLLCLVQIHIPFEDFRFILSFFPSLLVMLAAMTLFVIIHV